MEQREREKKEDTSSPGSIRKHVAAVGGQRTTRFSAPLHALTVTRFSVFPAFNIWPARAESCRSRRTRKLSPRYCRGSRTDSRGNMSAEDFRAARIKMHSRKYNLDDSQFSMLLFPSIVYKLKFDVSMFYVKDLI